MYLFIAVIAVVSFIILAILSIISIFNKKFRNKKIYLAMPLMVVIFITCAILDANKESNKKPTVTATTISNNAGTKEDKTKINDSDKALLKKAYADYDVKERTQFSEIEGKYKKLSDSEKEEFKADMERVLKEKDIQVAKWKEEAKKRNVIGVAKDLSAGEFTVGTDIEKGIYDVTPVKGQGNFTINNSKGGLMVNEIIGLGDFGCKKVRVVISDGDKIKLSSINKTHFEPVTSELIKEHSEVMLYSGYWSVGQDIGSGRYKACENRSSSSNFIVIDKNGKVKINEIISSTEDLGVKEFTSNLSEGDIIQISSSDGIKFVPQ